MPPSPLAPFKLGRIKGRTTPRTWQAAEELASSGRLTWTWSAAPDQVAAVGEVSLSGRAPYKVKVTWSGTSLRTACSCPSRRRRWLCSHRVALGLLLHGALTQRAATATAAAPAPAAAPGARSRASRASAPAKPPAPVRHQLFYALTPSLDLKRGVGLALSVSWSDPAAPGKLQPLRPGQLELRDPGLQSHDRDLLKLMGGFRKPARATRPAKSAVPWPIPAKVIEPVLEMLRVGPCRLLPTSQLRISPERLRIRLEVRPDVRGALYIRAELEGAVPAARSPHALLLGGAGISIVVLDDLLYRLEKPFDARLWLQLRGEGTRLPPGSVDKFLTRWSTQLEPFGLNEEVQHARATRIIRDTRPTPLLRLAAEEGRLLARLEFTYGPDVPPVTAARAESETLIQEGGRTFLIIRDRYQENQLEWQLLDHGLILLGGGAFTCAAEELPAFAVEALPRLENKGWRIEGREALARLGALPVDLAMRVRVRRRIDWFRFDLTAEAGDVRIPLREVIAAWKAGRRFLPLPGGRFGRLPEDWLERAGDLAEALATLPADGDGVRVAVCQVPLAAALAGQVEAREVDPAFAGMQARLEGLLTGPPAPLPRGLRATLRPYQLAGYRWLRQLAGLELGGILADDMGLGKTLQVLAALLAEKEAGATRPSLVVVPTSVLENWAREAARFTPDLRVAIFHGAGRKENPAIEGADLILTTYALLRRDLEFHAARAYHYVVLDEAQAIKNPDSDTARACRRLEARHRLTMTGTPIENRLAELWSQLAFLMPPLLGPLQSFQTRYAGPIEREGSALRRAELLRRVGPFILRRLKEEVATDLPPLTEDVLFCDLEPDQAALYAATLQASRKRIFAAIEAGGLDRARFSVLEALLKLRQICCHPALSGLDPDGRVKGSAKLELFMETLSEILEEGHRMLVFSQFVTMLEVIRGRLGEAGIDHLYLDGQTKERQALIDRFNSSSIPVFLISLKAGGSGLNLTGADYVLHYDPWWNPAVEAQATDRAHRIGQTRPVIAYKLITRGTVEEKMLELHARKRTLVEGLLAADEGVGRALTREDLEFLLPG